MNARAIWLLFGRKEASKIFAATLGRANLDTTANAEKDWRSAGLRHGGPAKVSCKGAVPEAGVPVVVSRRAPLGHPCELRSSQQHADVSKAT